MAVRTLNIIYQAVGCGFHSEALLGAFVSGRFFLIRNTNRCLGVEWTRYRCFISDDFSSSKRIHISAVSAYSGSGGEVKLGPA